MTNSMAHILDSIRELQRLADVFCDRRENLAKSVGLTVQQWRILEEISDEHFMPSMFARSQESSAAAVSKIIRQLLDKNLVQVNSDSLDGRVRRYNLSEKGKEKMAQLRKNRQKAIENVWFDLSPDQLDQFKELSSLLATRLENYNDKELLVKP